MLFKKIAIIGVGLIGGSIGLAVKKRKLADRVIGIGRSELSLQKALKKKAVDEISLDKSKVKNADLIILAAPVHKIPPLIKELLPYFKKGTIITDVGSTKQEIIEGLDKFLSPGVSFIGGHPLAGSEKNSVEFANADLFEKSICFLVPFKSTQKTLKKLKKFWEKLGACPIVISAEEHDFLVAGISHLPHIVAVALVNSLAGVNWRGKNITEFAGQGWKDTTRISGGLPEIWMDIFSSNADKLKIFVKKFDKQWKDIRDSLLKKDFKKLKIILEKAQRKSSDF
ncbi:MAG: prephenate dehydrogenase [Candidatus Ratteibacteria bacterium]|nr:prephenate dehydrogenase [Candidatus Ratteibacteria bacterium]